MSIWNKLWQNRKVLYYLPSSIYFNFHYLPFKQAIRMPIFLYKPNLIETKGKVLLIPDNGKIKTGMIRMGFRGATIYPNNGFMWENHGGTVIFRGKTQVGNDCYMSFGPNTTVDFGDDFKTTAGVKIVSYKGIKMGKSLRLGWGVLMMDTNIHPLYDMTKKRFKTASGPIEIGDYNWFGTQCKIMHSVTTPERCIFGMNTVVTRGSVAEPYCVMGGSPVKVLSQNVMRDYEHDTEELVLQYLESLK